MLYTLAQILKDHSDDIISANVEDVDNYNAKDEAGLELLQMDQGKLSMMIVHLESGAAINQNKSPKSINKEQHIKVNNWLNAEDIIQILTAASSGQKTIIQSKRRAINTNNILIAFIKETLKEHKISGMLIEHVCS